MRILSGTSGYSFREWKGPFYPEDLPAGRMLAFYAERLPAVELNATFYRVPKPEVVRRWAAQVPADFVFAVKANQRITHRARLGEGALEALAELDGALDGLGARRGPLLVQLPPSFRRDDARLTDFLRGAPAGLRLAFEFRHPSWDDEGVRAILAEHGAALCVAETDADPEPPRLHATTDWGYLRLRRAAYSEDDLRASVERVAARPWREAFMFFKHEDEGLAPRRALRIASLA